MTKAVKPSLPLPASGWLSLSATLQRIADRFGRRPSHDSVKGFLFSALTDDILIATGDIENINGDVVARNRIVSSDQWRSCLQEAEFGPACYHHRVFVWPSTQPSNTLFLINVRIKAAQLDRRLAHPCQKPEPTNTINNETECKEWLRQNATSGEKPKGYWSDKAKRRWPNLSMHGFNRAWDEVAKDNPAMKAPGRKPKSPR